MEIKFKRDTSFRKQFFVPESFAHPAKMDAQLLIWIVEHYTEADETILDPMAGMGTTMLACTLGRDVVLVELEEKFCKMMRDNWEQVKMRPQLGSTMGNCKIIQGDARQLEGLVDKIVTSPPYAEGLAGTGKGIDLSKTTRDGDIRHQSLGYLTKGVGFGGNPNNIGNLPYGEIDKCIFSPPYAETLQGSGADAARKRISEGKYKGLRPDVWTSKGNVAGSTFGDGYSRDPNGIGNLPYGQIDKIVTSPPYEEGLGHKDTRPTAQGMARPHYTDNPKADNIGNLKSQSYLEAMLQVYQQCYGVLKPEGLMILVTKNFIRNKQVIRLDEDTIKLCEQAGFSFVERHYRELPSQSFWRVIYHQKFPDVEQIKSEDVLVFKKLTIHNTPKC